MEAELLVFAHQLGRQVLLQVRNRQIDSAFLHWAANGELLALYFNFGILLETIFVHDLATAEQTDLRHCDSSDADGTLPQGFLIRIRRSILFPRLFSAELQEFPLLEIVPISDVGIVLQQQIDPSLDEVDHVLRSLVGPCLLRVLHFDMNVGHRQQFDQIFAGEFLLPDMVERALHEVLHVVPVHVDLLGGNASNEVAEDGEDGAVLIDLQVGDSLELFLVDFLRVQGLHLTLLAFIKE